MRPQGLPRDNVRLCFCSYLDSVDDWLLAIAQRVNENESQKNHFRKDCRFYFDKVSNLSSRFASDAKLIIWSYLLLSSFSWSLATVPDGPSNCEK